MPAVALTNEMNLGLLGHVSFANPRQVTCLPGLIHHHPWLYCSYFVTLMLVLMVLFHEQKVFVIYFAIRFGWIVWMLPAMTYEVSVFLHDNITSRPVERTYH